MNDFDQVLDDSIRDIASNGATPEECLARHPEYSGQLEPLLKTAALMEGGQELLPSENYKTRARGQLMEHMQAHPRRSRRKLSVVWNVAIGLAVLVMAFVLTGTAFAQSALPGQPLYDWKLSSEQIWRASSSDPVSVDLALANRRTFELTSLSNDAASKAQVLAEYQGILARLTLEDNALYKDRISYTLKSNQQKLSAAGINIPELDKHLSH